MKRVVLIKHKIVFSFIAFFLLFAIISRAQIPDTSFYANGKIEQVTIHLPDYVEKLIIFNEKGEITEILHRGFFNGYQTQVGTDTFFYPSGKIKETISHDNRPSKKYHDTHSGWTTEIKTKYYTNGKIQSKSSIKACYECDCCPCGVWKFYNYKGKLVKQKKYENCYIQECYTQEIKCLD